MLHVGLDLSRTRLDVHAMNEAGAPVSVMTAAPDAGGLASLVHRLGEFGQPVTAVIESMNGARFIHDQLELRGWTVEIADAVKVKGFAPLACKTDKIDAWVLAELSRRDLVPAIWLPTPGVRGERERARWRLHLVRHRTALKNRIHATLMAFGHPCPVTDLFGAAGRRLLDSLELPEPWAGDVTAALRLIEVLDGEIDDCEAALRKAGADHAYVPLLMSAPGIGWVLGYTIAAEIATSPDSRQRRSWSATPGCALRWINPVGTTGAGSWPRTARSTCAGPWSRRPPTPRTTRSTRPATSAPRPGWAASAGHRSPASTSPASSPRPSGTCSPPTSPSLRQAPPRPLWPHRRPVPEMRHRSEAPPIRPGPPREEAIER
jgi:transposase